MRLSAEEQLTRAQVITPPRLTLVLSFFAKSRADHASLRPVQQRVT
jgi:hypothetical protein